MISICMPYYQQPGQRRQELLLRSLDQYRALYSDMDLEIVVCDDGSPEPVEAPGCKVVTLPRKDHALCPTTPINTAVANASGDVLVLTNPEIEHREPVLQQMLDALESPADYVTASCQNPDGSWVAHSSLDPKGSGVKAPIPKGSALHFCAMFRPSLWLRAGGFDESLREGFAFDDNDWLWSLEAVGARFKHLDDAVVYHHTTGTRWPSGGWARNAKIVMGKWQHRWREVYG